MKICRVATVPFFFKNHLYNQIIATINAGHSVTLISGSGEEINQLEKIPGIKVHLIEIPRTIKPIKDIVALVKLYKYFRQNQFDIIHSTTPKAGLLSAVAGILAGIPIRIHTFTGQAWVELRGISRYLAIAGDWITARLCSMIYADSSSQKDFIVESGVAKVDKISVIGNGSLAGVDLKKFEKDCFKNKKESILIELGINLDTTVISFVGRVTKDKGVMELVEAFSLLSEKINNLALLLIGPQEPERDPLTDKTLMLINDNPFIYELGYSPEPEKYLAITDIFCLPSYREGFGNVVIEAAAMGVPTVGTSIVGLQDSIVDGVTGLLIPPKDVHALKKALEYLIENPSIRVEMGENAKLRAIRNFDSTEVNASVISEYSRLFKAYACK